METSQHHIDGIWEDILLRSDELLGRRVRVIVLVDDAMAGKPAHTGSIQDRVLAIAAGIPEEEQASLPPGLTDNLDHYVYGTPRQK